MIRYYNFSINNVGLYLKVTYPVKGRIAASTLENYCSNVDGNSDFYDDELI